jgi:hypothetical protein
MKDSAFAALAHSTCQGTGRSEHFEVAASESAMLRSVEREDCAERDGDFVCCDARRRLWGAEPSLA